MVWAPAQPLSSQSGERPMDSGARRTSQTGREADSASTFKGLVGTKNPRREPRVLFQKKRSELGGVVTNRFDGATLFGLFAARLFFRRFRLFEHVGITAILVALKVIRRRFATEIAINALVVDVIFAGGILRVFICCVSHKIIF